MEIFSVRQGLDGKEASREAAVDVEKTEDGDNSKWLRDARNRTDGDKGSKMAHGVEKYDEEKKEKGETTDKAKTKKKKTKKGKKGGK